MLEYLESLAGTQAAIVINWAIALIVFIFWLITEIWGMASSSLIRWKPLILKSLRIGFVLSLVLPLVLGLIGSLVGPWGVLVVVLGISYLPPSVYILCISLGGFYSFGRFGRALTTKQKKHAYAIFAGMAMMGSTMMYVSLVWLDKPV